MTPDEEMVWQAGLSSDELDMGDEMQELLEDWDARLKDAEELLKRDPLPLVEGELPLDTIVSMAWRHRRNDMRVNGLPCCTWLRSIGAIN